MAVAFLTTVLPRGGRLGGDIGSQVFVDALRAGYADLKVLGYDRPSDNADPVAWETVVARRPIESSNTRGSHVAFWLACAALRRRPYSVQKYVSRRYRTMVRDLAHSGVELFVIDHAQSGWLVPELGGRPYIFIAHNVEGEVYRSQARSARHPLARHLYRREAKLIGAFEHRLAAKAEAVWTITERDARHFSELLGGGGHPVASFAQPPSQVPAPAALAPPTFDVALLGTWGWEANAAGLRWFADNVVPRLRHGTDIRVAGLGGADVLRERSGLTAVGRVPDAVDFLRSARVVAIPTQGGGGVQIKSIDATASGARIVATTLAMRGIADLPNHVVIADDPADFAREITTALRRDRDPREVFASHDWAKQRVAAFHQSVLREAARVFDRIAVRRSSCVRTAISETMTEG